MAVAARHDSGTQLDHRAARRPQPFVLFAFWILIFHGCLLYHRPAFAQGAQADIVIGRSGNLTIGRQETKGSPLVQHS
jgi:hypothetical protein